MLCLALAAGWLLTLLGMPGNWLIVAAAALYVLVVPGESRLAIGWPAVALLAGLAILGEIAELVAEALGVSKAGGSRRSAAWPWSVRSSAGSRAWRSACRCR